MAGDIVDGEHVESEEGLPDMALGEKAPCCASNDMLLFGSHAQFRQSDWLIAHGPLAHFHKRQRFSVEASQINFALCANRMIVS